MIASDTTRPSGSVTAGRDSGVGVIGLGHMGHAFAVNLVADGYEVFVYDRDPKRAATLIGASAAVRLGDLAACNVVLTSSPDDDALAEVALGPEGLAAILKPGAVHISTSTVSPGMSRRVVGSYDLDKLTNEQLHTVTSILKLAAPEGAVGKCGDRSAFSLGVSLFGLTGEIFFILRASVWPAYRQARAATQYYVEILPRRIGLRLLVFLAPQPRAPTDRRHPTTASGS